MLIKLFSWLFNPIINKYSKTKPIYLMSFAIIIVALRNMPLDENIFNIWDIEEWAYHSFFLISITYGSRHIMARKSISTTSEVSTEMSWLAKIIRWYKTPLLPGKPQSSPVLTYLFAFGYLIFINWPLSENTIAIQEIVVVFCMASFFVFLAWFVTWYSSNKNM